MGKRLLIVLACYALSSVGLLAMSQLIREERNAIGYVWIAAWLIHMVMSIFWIRDLRLPRIWPGLGVAFGASSFLAWYLFGKGSSLGDEYQSTVATVVLMQALLVLPCLVLALWLVRFHWNSGRSGAIVGKRAYEQFRYHIERFKRTGRFATQ